MMTVAAAEVTKTMDGVALPRSSFLVASGDAVSDWHLPVKGPDGKADRGRMAAAHAALLGGPGGHRGNPYSGPDKEQAIKRLRALYRAEGMDWPEDQKKGAEPDAGDLHVNDYVPGATSGTTRRRQQGHFTRKLLADLRGRLAERGMVRADEFDALVSLARAHAGGMTKAERRRAQQMAEGDATLTLPCAECAAENYGDCSCPGCAEEDACWCAIVQDRELGDGLLPGVPDSVPHAMGSEHVRTDGGEAFRLFVPVACAEAPEWIPYLPTPGTYKHAIYGDITLPRERIADMVSKFNAGVYQHGPDGGPSVPIDGEHATKVSGAMGWIRQMRLNVDGSADARVEWTDRGRQMLAEERYKFFSPEYYDSWTDPATGQTITNVAIGGALVTRPHFKTNAQGSALRPLVAGEQGIYVPGEDTRTTLPFVSGAGVLPADDGGQQDQQQAPGGQEKERTMPAGTGTGTGTETPFVLTEDQKRFAEMERQLAEQKAATDRAQTEARTLVEAAQAEAKQAAERITAMEQAAQLRSYAEVAQGWQGDTPQRFAEFMLREIRTAEGVEWFQKLQRAHAEQVKKAGLWSEVGRSGVGAESDDPQERLQQMVKAAQAEGKLTARQAAEKVAREHPDLVEEAKRASEIVIGSASRGDDD